MSFEYNGSNRLSTLKIPVKVIYSKQGIVRGLHTLNPEGFVDHLLLKIRDHLEKADGNEWAASDIALTGPRQTSFLEHIAERLPLHTAYGTVCSDLLQKRQAQGERERQRERRRQQQQIQNQQGNNSSSNGNGQNQGRGSQTQQSDSKVSTITQEEGKKKHVKHGMGGS